MLLLITLVLPDPEIGGGRKHIIDIPNVYETAESLEQSRT
jgi:hypothetical protein